MNDKYAAAVKAYRERTGASLQEGKAEVDRFKENPEAYEAEESNQEQRRRDLERCVRDIFREAEILEHLNARYLDGFTMSKSRSDVLTYQMNHDIFIEHIEDILAPVFGVDLDEDEDD